MQYRPDIDGLRAIAVIPVVVYHAGLGLSGGFVGVDIFFAISGYLITSLLLIALKENRFSLIDFYERRARRLFPALFTVISAATVVAPFVLLPEDLKNYGVSVISSVLFVANIWFFAGEGYFTEAAELKPMLHMWSLGVEEQFYVFFPILLYVLWKHLRLSTLAFVLAGLAALSFFLSVGATIAAPSAAFFLAPFRAWELAAGSLLAFAAIHGNLAWLGSWRFLPNLLASGGLAAIAYAVIFFGPETPFPGTAAILPCLGAIAIIAAGQFNTVITRMLSIAPMIFVGKLSYSLYLWHWPIISLLYYTSPGPLTVVQGVTCIIVSFVLAYLTWLYIEQPFRDRKRVSPPTIIGLSATGVIGAVTVSAALILTNGLPARLPPQVLAMTEASSFHHDREECHNVTPERAKAGDVCVRGVTDAEPTIVLVGDSHANAFSPAFFSAAASLGLSGYHYTFPDFRPLPNIEMRGYPRWRNQTDAFIRFLDQHPNVRTVYVTGYWQQQMTGYTYRHAGRIWFDEDYDGSGSDYNTRATLAGLRRLAERFPDRTIVLLDDVPTGSALHTPELARMLFHGHPLPEGLPLEEAQAQRNTYDPYFRQMAEEAHNIMYAPIFLALCNESVCPLMKGQTIIFRDGDHLSAEGALLLSELARGVIEKTAQRK
jgi:peptidoglycan/LPS O-acetylase OafA/YrhL